MAYSEEGYNKVIVKQIPDYNDYLISENGDVFSNKFGKIRKLKSFKTGYNCYLSVKLFSNGEFKQEKVHRLVLMAFDRMPKNGEQCRHFPDNDRSNNHYKNLQWGSAQENNEDMWKFHKTGKIPDNSNEKNGSCKLTDKEVLEIRQLYMTGKFNQYELADKYCVNQSNISFIVRNKTRKERGRNEKSIVQKKPEKKDHTTNEEWME